MDFDVRDAREIPREKFCRAAIYYNKRRDIDNNSFYNLALSPNVCGETGGRKKETRVSRGNTYVFAYVERVILLSL